MVMTEEAEIRSQRAVGYISFNFPLNTLRNYQREVDGNNLDFRNKEWTDNKVQDQPVVFEVRRAIN